MSVQNASHFTLRENNFWREKHIRSANFLQSVSRQMKSKRIFLNLNYLERMVFTYPKVEKSDFVEDFHGEKIADPFSPLEEPDAEITKKFVTEQNEVFQVKKRND